MWVDQVTASLMHSFIIIFVTVYFTEHIIACALSQGEYVVYSIWAP